MNRSLSPTPYALLCAGMCLLSGCYLLDELPAYDGPPCDPIADLTAPAYLCDDETRGVVFVDPAGGDDTSDASREAPVASLTRALELASDNPEVVAVLLAGAPELDVTGLTLEDKTSIIAGYTTDWRRDASQRPRFSSQGPLRLVGGDDAGEVVVLRGFDLTVAASQTSATVGVLIDRQDVRLLDVVVTVGDAAGGSEGADGGGPALEGSPGGNGGQGARIEPGPGGVNGADAQANGGDGGSGGDSQNGATPGSPSTLGVDGGGVGMAGGDGQDGAPGSVGTDAVAGTWSSGGWTPGQAATAGEPGEPGRGGGGGGGGATSGGQGGGGGGGGAGGAGGVGGGPGVSGFPSAGLVAIEARVELVESVVRAGKGGDAGRGGAGALGGEGGIGGAGSSGVNGGETGGRGGQGGRGGDGGKGGDGVAGTSHGVVCLEASLMETGSTVEAGAPGLVGETPAAAARTLGCD